MTVPVEVELPPSVLDICWWHSDEACADGRDPGFEDYLWDLLVFEPTFVGGGDETDMGTGRPVDASDEVDE